MALPSRASHERCALRIRGVVQGVGFRPAMYRLARSHALSGFVRNEIDVVHLEVEGRPDALGRFIDDLPRSIPPAARLDSIERAPMAPVGDTEFRIDRSPEARNDVPAAAIPVDRATCEACLRELADPRDRRHRYPFINCTDCGPRFTIVERVPYDRPFTTMSAFALCGACRREYDDPDDRRFHAEPNACPACGPKLAWIVRGERRATGDEALRAAARAVADGAVVAVKGIGGYLLAADATNEQTVALLRARKRRPHKPFAVMARDLETAEQIAVLDGASRALLRSVARPIVLVPRRAGARLAASVAPGVGDVGVFLPPSPLQQLLLDEGPALQVMTSGNLSEEPIAKDDDDAVARLSGIADAFLTHDRPIHSRADDSVVRVIGGVGVPVRRARGYVPEAVSLPVHGPPVLAMGADTKSTVCLAQDGRAVLSQHLGDLDHPDTLAFLDETIAHLGALTGITPEVVAHDLHPDYRSTRRAQRSGLRAIAVQHHHAHVASLLAEHGRTGPILGVAFDGTGFGPDGAVWGGEILLADFAGYRRLGHLAEIGLAGGERAIREPWRLALAALVSAGLAGEAPRLLGNAPPGRLHDVRRLLEAPAGGRWVTRATGAGRWFDAVAVLVGLRGEITYDGQAAIELEAIAEPGEAVAYPWDLRPSETDRPFVIDLVPAVRAVVRDLRDGVPAPRISARFHETMARAITTACASALSLGAPRTVGLTGGCFQNRRLATRTAALLDTEGFEVLTHRRVPPNDGGIALGQAAVAAMAVRSSRGES